MPTLKKLNQTAEAYKALLNYGACGAIAAIVLGMLAVYQSRSANREDRLVNSTIETDQKLVETMAALKQNSDQMRDGAAKAREERAATAAEIRLLSKAADSERELLTNVWIEIRGMRNDQRVPNRMPPLPSIKR